LRRDIRVVRSCALEALRDFRWHEYAPFGWILAIQLVVLVLAMNLGSGLGMATAGGLARVLGEERQLHYPGFYLYLPVFSSVVESFCYTLPGSVLIPLSLVRILAPMDPDLRTGSGVVRRLRQAFPPTLVASLLSLGLLSGWQWIVVGLGPAALLRGWVPGFAGVVMVWGISLLGAYAVAALFLYVPVVAIRPRATFVDALRDGVSEGTHLLGFTLLLVVLFSLPTLPALFIVQLQSGFLVEKLRPEVVGYGLAIYMILTSLASYLTYAAVARLHWADQAEYA
jgi:hypothetical protein